jgi:hypothetical protein
MSGHIASGMPLIFRLLSGLCEAAPSTPVDREQRRHMIERFLHRWPQITKERWLFGDEWLRPLEVAISFREELLSKSILHLAPESLAFGEGEEMVGGKSQTVYPTLTYAFGAPCTGIMRMMVEAGAFLPERYLPSALGTLSGLRAVFVACSFPLKPEYEDKYKRVTAHRDDIGKLVDTVLAAGFPSFQSGYNVTLRALFSAEYVSIMEEEHAISYLLKCREAGMDIIHDEEEGVGKPNAYTLLHWAAKQGYNKVLDLAIELQGPECVNSWFTWKSESGKVTSDTALTLALGYKKLDTALHLLQRHKAKASYKSDVPDTPTQPLICAADLYDDALALPVVQELIRQDPLLCDLNWQKESVVPSAGMSPVSRFCLFNMPRCLEALLAAKLRGVQELCTQTEMIDAGTIGYPRIFHSTPAQWAAHGGFWEILFVLLRYCPTISVTAHGKATTPDGTLVAEKGSINQTVTSKGAPRNILTMFEAMAARQEAEQKRGRVTAASSVVPSNAFEEPGSKVVSEKEEKQKAKRRAAKKKAKEKKRTAAAVAMGNEENAGAGKEADGGDSDSDSSGTDEEEAGLDDEERMIARAPTFDLEKEKAARRARAEAEAKAMEEEKSRRR